MSAKSDSGSGEAITTGNDVAPATNDVAAAAADVQTTPVKTKTPVKKTPATANNKRKAVPGSDVDLGTPVMKVPKTNAGGAGDFPNTDVQLMVEVSAHIGAQIRAAGSNVTVDWKSLAERLKLPSAGAASKRFERFLKHFDKKTSDITGKGGRAAKSKGGASGETGENAES